MDSCSKEMVSDDNNFLHSVITAIDSKNHCKASTERSSLDKPVSETTNFTENQIQVQPEQSGAAEFAIYCRNLGRPRSPPAKPQRHKLYQTCSVESSNGGSNNIGSELQEIIESAFNKDLSDDHVHATKNSVVLVDDCSLEKPAAVFERDPFCENTTAQQTNYNNAKNVDFATSNVRRHLVNTDDQEVSILRGGSTATLDSLSLGSINSLESWVGDGESSGLANYDSHSLLSFTATPNISPVHGSNDSKNKRKDNLKKKISKAVAQKQKVGAIFDAATGSAGEQLKKFSRIKSVRFPARLKARQQNTNKLAESEESGLPKVRLTPLPEGSRIRTKETLGSPTDRHLPTKSGFLKKQGGTIKTWNSRWFILNGDQLHYYKDMDGKYIASIPLVGNHVVTHPVKSNDTNKFVFEIYAGGEGQKMSSNHESYILSANTQADMEEWVKVIRRVISSRIGGGIFGQHLEQTLLHDRRMESSEYDASSSRMSNSMDHAFCQTPMIVENCVEFIRNYGGLKEEGLFRLPGHANEVKDLQDAYDRGERPIFPKTTDVHTVASLLKGFLRELAEPVIPFERYEALIGWAKLSFATDKESPVNKNDVTMTVLKEQLDLLPQSNFHLLRYLCRFLDEVQQQSSVNKMDISNLAMVFGPNIMRSKKNDAITMMSDANLVQHVIFQFIAKHKMFFPEDQRKDVPIASTTPSLSDVALDATEKCLNHNLDPGVENITSSVSRFATLDVRHRTDGSETDLLEPIADTTNHNTPVASFNSISRHKPIKPLRRKLSDQSVLKKEEIIAPNSNVLQRNSMCDNVTISSIKNSDASKSCISQSSNYSNEKEKSKPSKDFLSLTDESLNEVLTCTNNQYVVPRSSVDTKRFSTTAITEIKYNPESFAATEFQSSIFKSESDNITITESIASDNQSTITISNQGFSANIPTVPSRPHRKIKKDGKTHGDATSVISLDPIPTSRETATVAPPDAGYDSKLTYRELEEKIIILQEEVRKQRIEHKKRTEMLEEHYFAKITASSCQNSFPPVISGIGTTSADIQMPVLRNKPSRNQSTLLDEIDADQYLSNSHFDCRMQSVNSQEDLSQLRYEEEVKRHAMTKIKLRNAELGLKQAEHRNNELQKEMDEFYHTIRRI